MTNTLPSTGRIIYSDLNATVSMYLGPDVVTNLDAVVNHIANIFFTRHNEVDFEPTFGANLLENLFDLPTAYAEWEIITQLREAFAEWETDVVINPNGTSITKNTDNAQITIYLVISIKNLNLSNITLKMEFNL